MEFDCDLVDAGRTAFARKYLAGKSTELSEWREFLTELYSGSGLSHARIGDSRTSLGSSSFEVLINAAAAANPALVIDLGCGDGTLLERGAHQLGGDTELVGIDRSRSQTRRAQTSLAASSNACAIRAEADRLPVATAGADVVVSHFALAEMLPLEPVLAEVARVLRPGGVFAVALQTSTRLSGIPGWGKAMRQFFDAAHPDCDFRPHGDSRVATIADAAALLETVPGLGTPSVTEYQLFLSDTPEELWQEFSTTGYTFRMLPPAEVATIGALLLPALRSAVEDQARVTLVVDCAVLEIGRT